MHRLWQSLRGLPARAAQVLRPDDEAAGVNRDRTIDEPEAVAALESTVAALAALEPALDGLRGDAATIERARRAAQRLSDQAGRILERLDRSAPGFAPSTWQGQERRSPHRATNVARLPERMSPPSESPAADPSHWEPF